MIFIADFSPEKFCERLVTKEHQLLIKAYYRWLLLLSRRGLGTHPLAKNSFNLLYRAVSRPWPETFLLGMLQQQFIKENLSLSLLLEPLDGFEWISKNRYPLDFSTSSPILMQIISPLTRLIVVLNHEHPVLYQPFSIFLCVWTALFLTDSPNTVRLLKSADITFNRQHIIKTLPLQYREALRLLPQIKGFRYKIKMAWYLGICRVLLKKIAKKNKNPLIFLDYINAFLYALWYIITIRAHALKQNRVKKEY